MHLNKTKNYTSSFEEEKMLPHKGPAQYRM
jgi:hypothetical protein